MKAGDYKDTPQGKVVKSTTGVEYLIKDKLGKGGVATTFFAKRLTDNKECVFKEFIHDSADRELMKLHSDIKNNISKLMTTPIKNSSFIGPLDKDSLITFPSGGFGYIMDLVDTKKFKKITTIWRTPKEFPDAKILCEVVINLASLMNQIHSQGWCYKDISVNNVLIDTKTGEIRMIDSDNVSIPARKTILGTQGFIAPEVYVSEMPDRPADYFGMASFFYMLFTGGHPLYGKKVHKYLIDKNLMQEDAAATVYGPQMALFAFDPKDKSNEIRGLVDPCNPNRYRNQTNYWARLPIEFKKLFIKTFHNGLKDKRYRADNKDWIQAAKTVQGEAIVRCSKFTCRKMAFGDVKGKRTCLYCQKVLPKLIGKKTIPVPVDDPNQVPPQPPIPVGELTTVVFVVKRNTSNKNVKITAKRKASIKGPFLHPELKKDGWMTIEYSESRKKLGAKNNCPFSWSVKDSRGVKTECKPGERVVLEVGTIIVVLPRKIQLTVMEIK